MPHTVHITAIVNAPLDKVWPLFCDFNGLGGWHPGVAQSRLEEGGRHDAVGSVRHLTLKPAGFVREQLLMLDDPNTALRYAIIETDLPMRDYVAGISLHPVTEGAARWCSGGPTSAWKARGSAMWLRPWDRTCSRPDWLRWMKS